MPAKNVKPKRGPGRPPPEERAIVPADWPRIRRMWCRGYSSERIAAEYSVNRTTMDDHLTRHILPWMRADAISTRDDELNRLNETERTAWEQFESNAPREVVDKVEEKLAKEGGTIRCRSLQRRLKGHEGEWLAIVLDCIDKRSRILGHYAPTAVTLRMEGELRLAGGTIAELSEAMVQRMIEKIEQRRLYEEQVKQITVEAGERQHGK